MTLDTKKLEDLCERVVRKCREINGDALPMAKDWAWAELTHEALPDLLKYISNEKSIL